MKFRFHRARRVGFGAALGLVVVLAAVAVAVASSVEHYAGRSSRGQAVSFTVKGSKVSGFRFVNRCPSDSVAGTLVPGSMRIRNGAFARRDRQFTITGKISGRTASGTARDVTGDCNSGSLGWHAKR